MDINTENALLQFRSMRAKLADLEQLILSKKLSPDQLERAAERVKSMDPLKQRAPELAREAGVEITCDGKFVTIEQLSSGIQIHFERKAARYVAHNLIALFTDPEFGD